MLKITLQISISIVFTFGLFYNQLNAQTKSEHVQIIEKFEQWKIIQFNKRTYIPGQDCNPAIAVKKGYDGTIRGIPKNLEVFFTDINSDKKVDALITFRPEQCDGGNALMNTQSRVLILSKGEDYVIDDTSIDNIEDVFKAGSWLIIEGAAEGAFYGAYYEYKDTDGHCCPSIKRPFSVDFKTKMMTFADEK
ncbi:MAG: hypothetical protein WBP45_12680 [Daejeonella sp.]